MTEQEPVRIKIKAEASLVNIIEAKDCERHYIRLENISFQYKNEIVSIESPRDIRISKAQYNDLKAQLTEPTKHNTAYLEDILELKIRDS